MEKNCGNCRYFVPSAGHGFAAGVCFFEVDPHRTARVRFVERSECCCHFKAPALILTERDKLDLSAGLIKLVPLTQRNFAIVDAEDYPVVAVHKWYSQRKPHTVYAKTKIGKSDIFMHRFIVNASPEKVVDHADRRGLNNRRSNLRQCSASQNQANRAKSKFKKSTPYKGVSYHKKRNHYSASITINRTTHHLGYFADPEEAARAYDKKAKELFGTFACLNFPEEK